MTIRFLCRATAVAIVAATMMPVSAADATLTMNPALRYQTIDGFGTYWAGPADQNFANFLANDLGESMIRFQLSTDFCPSRGSYNQGAISGDIAQMNRMKALGVTKWICSVWSPPAWMKTNNDIANGGNLKPECYQDFANMVVAYCKAIKQGTGTELYAFSIQNELEFVEWYVSCVYDPTMYRDVVKVLGPALRAAGLTTQLFGPEAMTSPNADFTGPIMRDTTAKQYWGNWAFHGYSNGVNPVPSGEAAGLWKRLKMGLGAYKKPLWMTETSGVPDTWAGAMDLAGNIYAALRYGDLAAWVWWHDCGGGGSTGDLESLLNTAGCAHSQRSLTSKNFYKWIRPGAVRMDCKFGGDSTNLFALSFYHVTNKTLTIVMLNQGTASKTVTIGGAACPANLQLFRTTSSENCADKGSVASGSVTLTAGSVNTLYATNYNPPVGVAPQPEIASARSVSPANTVLRAFGLDGRMVPSTRAPAAVRAIVRGDASGRILGAVQVR